MTEYLCTFFRNGCFIRIQIDSDQGEEAVDAEADLHPVRHGLDVDIGGARADRVAEQRIDRGRVGDVRRHRQRAAGAGSSSDLPPNRLLKRSVIDWADLEALWTDAICDALLPETVARWIFDLSMTRCMGELLGCEETEGYLRRPVRAGRCR